MHTNVSVGKGFSIGGVDSPSIRWWNPYKSKTVQIKSASLNGGQLQTSLKWLSKMISIFPYIWIVNRWKIKCYAYFLKTKLLCSFFINKKFAYIFSLFSLGANARKVMPNFGSLMLSLFLCHLCLGLTQAQMSLLELIIIVKRVLKAWTWF